MGQEVYNVTSSLLGSSLFLAKPSSSAFVYGGNMTLEVEDRFGCVLSKVKCERMLLFGSWRSSGDHLLSSLTYIVRCRRHIRPLLAGLRHLQRNALFEDDKQKLGEHSPVPVEAQTMTCRFCSTTFWKIPDSGCKGNKDSVSRTFSSLTCASRFAPLSIHMETFHTSRLLVVMCSKSGFISSLMAFLSAPTFLAPSISPGNMRVESWPRTQRTQQLRCSEWHSHHR